MADREEEKNWREGGMTAKVNGILHLVAADWKEEKGKEGDLFQLFTSLLGKWLQNTRNM